MLCMNPGGLIIDVFCNFKALCKIKFRAQERSFTHKWFIYFQRIISKRFLPLFQSIDCESEEDMQQRGGTEPRLPSLVHG